MKLKQWLIVALLFGFSLVPSTLFAQAPTEASKPLTSLSPMLKKIMPAIVNITVLGELPLSNAYAFLYDNQPLQDDSDDGNDDSNGSTDDQNSNSHPIPPLKSTPRIPKNPKFQDMGSGVIVDASNGYIVTNAHVLTNAKIVTVTLSDGRRFNAKLVGVDKMSDIAVLKINAKNLVAVPLANSDEVNVGDFVAAIGNPFGLNQTVTSGVISALNRSDLGIEGYENFIQTDTPINPGNSGGALVNLQGQLVGINTALIGPVNGNVGISFAIPSNMVKSVFDELVKYGKVKRGVLGVMVQDLTPALADAMNLTGLQGALVTNVTPNSPAAKSGLRSQDVVVKINNTPVTNSAQLRNIIGLMPIGAKVTMDVRRQKESLSVSANIINPRELRMNIQPALAAFFDGVRLTSYDEIVPDLGPIKGVGVVDVDQTTVAWLDGLRAGDIIVEANNKPISNITDLMQAASVKSDRLLLKVSRGAGILFLVINA